MRFNCTLQYANEIESDPMKVKVLTNGTRLPKSRVGGEGPYLRAPDHLGRSIEVKEIKS